MITLSLDSFISHEFNDPDTVKHIVKSIFFLGGCIIFSTTFFFYKPNLKTILKLLYNFAFHFGNVLFSFVCLLLAFKYHSPALNIWLTTVNQTTKKQTNQNLFPLWSSFYAFQNLYLNCSSRLEGTIFLRNLLLQPICFNYWRSILIHTIIYSGSGNKYVKKLI